MKKLLTIILLSLLTFGCATAKKDFITIYNDSIKGMKSTAIVSDLKFDELKKKVNKHLKEVGYSKVVFLKPENGFMVLVKNAAIGQKEQKAEDNPYKIILKYTNVGGGKTRVDLVNAANKRSVKKQVDQDISLLEILIKGD